MNLDNLNKWLTLTANLGVVIGIVFLGLEIQQNTNYLRRGEMNATMDQISVMRMEMLNSDLADLLVRSREGYEALSPQDRLRLSTFYDQWIWASYQIYDREQGGYLDAGEWDRGGRAIIRGYIDSPTGREWWEQTNRSFPPGFREKVNETFNAQ